MLVAKLKIESQFDRNELLSRVVEFDTISELESFIAYNRAYIRELSFTGKIKAGEE